MRAVGVSPRSDVYVAHSTGARKCPADFRSFVGLIVGGMPKVVVSEQRRMSARKEKQRKRQNPGRVTGAVVAPVEDG